MLKEFVRIYTITGGMPEVVKTYIESKDLHECQNNQADILQTYRRDFHKYAKNIRLSIWKNFLRHFLFRPAANSNIQKLILL
jgi:predicted AAA+ superfamily ATPase